MIRYTTGDVLRADVDAIVNTVNCVGVMGRGIALQFKKTFPSNYENPHESSHNSAQNYEKFS